MKVVCNTNGFSLIETLVAVSILSLVMAGVGIGAIATVSTNYQNSSLVAATTLAQGKLEELTALDDLPVMPVVL
jgi:prepilin-type N-terminal cleavage/methylation domain-containing protein